MPQIKAHFGTLQDLVHQMAATSGQVDTEMMIWSGASSAAQATWLDQAGGAFRDVGKEWGDLAALQQDMLARLQTAVDDSLNDYGATLQTGVNTFAKH
jgi:uncharacterized protein YukE